VPPHALAIFKFDRHDPSAAHKLSVRETPAQLFAVSNGLEPCRWPGCNSHLPMPDSPMMATARPDPPCKKAAFGGRSRRCQPGGLSTTGAPANLANSAGTPAQAHSPLRTWLRCGAGTLYGPLPCSPISVAAYRRTLEAGWTVRARCDH